MAYCSQANEANYIGLSARVPSGTKCLQICPQFSPLEMQDSNDMTTSVSLTFLEFRLRVTETWDLGPLDAAVGKKHCYARWCAAWCLWANKSASVSLLSVSHITHHSHHSHLTQHTVSDFLPLSLISLTCSSRTQTRNCLQFLQYYLYISHCQSSLSTPLPSKEEKLLKTHWYCLALTMTYYIGI